MKRLFVALLFVAQNVAAQVPHVTQPFFYLWDYPTANIIGSPGFTQVAHFEHQLDGTVPVMVPTNVPTSVSSAVPGFSTFKLSADVNLAPGPHSFNVLACPTLVASTAIASGCVATPSPFAFVLDAPALLPLGSAQRLGVGL